jgi:hypothetical protein
VFDCSLLARLLRVSFVVRSYGRRKWDTFWYVVLLKRWIGIRDSGRERSQGDGALIGFGKALSVKVFHRESSPFRPSYLLRASDVLVQPGGQKDGGLRAERVGWRYEQASQCRELSPVQAGRTLVSPLAQTVAGTGQLFAKSLGPFDSSFVPCFASSCLRAVCVSLSHEVHAAGLDVPDSNWTFRLRHVAQAG